MTRQQKITFGEMRASGASRIIVHCGDYKCGHSITMYPPLWSDNVRLSDHGAFARSAVTVALMSGHCSNRLAWAQTANKTPESRNPPG